MLEEESGYDESITSVESSIPELTGEEEQERRRAEAMGARESGLATEVMRHIGNHVKERKLGRTIDGTCGYEIETDEEKKLRFPDGTFIARGRLPNDRLPSGNLKLVPDFVLEVVSPHNSAYEVEEKRVLYLRAGVRLLWVVYPTTRTLHVWRSLKSCVVLDETDTLTDEDVFAGFSCPVALFFENV